MLLWPKVCLRRPQAQKPRAHKICFAYREGCPNTGLLPGSQLVRFRTSPASGGGPVLRDEGREVSHAVAEGRVRERRLRAEEARQELQVPASGEASWASFVLRGALRAPQ